MEKVIAGKQRDFIQLWKSSTTALFVAGSPSNSCKTSLVICSGGNNRLKDLFDR
jgi:hypothetical protein